MTKKICLIDIGGTNTRILIKDKEGNTLDKTSFATIDDIANKTFDKICDFISKYDEIEAIGMSAPGPSDYEKGIFFNLPNNPKWKNFKFKEYLLRKTGIKRIYSENDANLMALANHFHFKGMENDVTQFFTVSTGLGAGLIINNKIFHGAHGYAEEVAFSPVSWIKEENMRFGPGALEYFVSGSGLMERTKNKFTTTEDIFKSYNSDDFAKEIINDGIETLANMIATTVAILNPSLMIFDGAVARNNNWYVEKAFDMAKKISSQNHFENLKLYFGQLGDDSALEGAYKLVLQNIK